MSIPIPVSVYQQAYDPISENTNPILMTQTEYARDRSKSPQYIGKL
jgi:hypothetical protein